MHDTLVQMANFWNCGWDLSRFKDLLDWAVQLSSIQLSMLKRHCSILVRLSELIQYL